VVYGSFGYLLGKCEEEGKQIMINDNFLSKLSNPARSALESNGINTLEELSKYSEKEILKLHGIGPASLPKLRQSLEEKGLSFRKIEIYLKN